MEENNKISNELTGHLSDEEIALCAQEMVLGSYPVKIHAEIQAHLNACHQCKTTVLDLYYLVVDEPAVKDALGMTKQPEGKKQIKSFLHKKRLIARSNLIGWHTVAAAAILVIAISVFFIVNQKPVHEKLFTQYYSPYHDVVTSKSQAERNLLLDGLFYYNTAQYDSAVAKFAEGLETQPSDHDLLFYLASSYLATGNYEQAIVNFEQLSEPGSKYYSPSRWYLAMAYLGSKELNEARRLLEPIREEGGFYSQKAGKILAQLR